jgi:predicted RNA-binding Zn-ribbon protein involved in translation (DUF1610 family)
MATIQEMIKKLQRFGDEIQDLSQKTFTILPDREGLLDRQCPNCKLLFMINDDDWDKLATGMYCPSCGQQYGRSDFITEAHHEEGKESIRKSLLDNWEDSTSISNNVVTLQSTLGLQNLIKCVSCNTAFASSEPAEYCPCCGTLQKIPDVELK